MYQYIVPTRFEIFKTLIMKEEEKLVFKHLFDHFSVVQNGILQVEGCNQILQENSWKQVIEAVVVGQWALLREKVDRKRKTQVIPENRKTKTEVNF